MKSIRLIGLSAMSVLMAGMVSCDEETPEFYNPTESETKGGIFDAIAKDEMALVEGGTFLMGATAEQGVDVFDDEKPVHEVTLSDFYICKYEVTQVMWEYVMNYNGQGKKPQIDPITGDTIKDENGKIKLVTLLPCPDIWSGYDKPTSTYGLGDYYPAYYVSYDDVVKTFLPRLDSITDVQYRLPTEAEWEYAARGGNKSKGYKYSGSNSIGNVAWYENNSLNTTHIVGMKDPNELGLYDMSGNVWEWCSDWYDTNYYSSSETFENPAGPETGMFHVHRGGSWPTSGDCCRVSYRRISTPKKKDHCIGFRLVCSAK